MTETEALQKTVTHLRSPQFLILNLDVLQSQRDIGIQIETGAFARLQFHRSRGGDHRCVVG